jgi:DNA-directed RNA polymerase specialized sigma24 family protein
MICFDMDDSDRYARMVERGDMTLMKEVAYGSMDAFEELMDRYLDLVSRTSFRILCDRRDSEFVTASVFVSLWHDVLDYDDSYTLGEWLLSKTYRYSRIRITRRRILKVFGVVNDVFVNVSPSVDDEDDYVTKQAWELHCRASSHMTPLQSAVYAMCILDGISEESVSRITGMPRFRIALALEGAEEKARLELKYYGREKDYNRYNSFLRKVADSLTDMAKLKKMIIFAV